MNIVYIHETQFYIVYSSVTKNNMFGQWPHKIITPLLPPPFFFGGGGGWLISAGGYYQGAF